MLARPLYEYYVDVFPFLYNMLAGPLYEYYVDVYPGLQHAGRATCLYTCGDTGLNRHMEYRLSVQLITLIAGSRG